MSEYQYYEFQAIDRPLTMEEMSELRSYSTRARITPTSFVNDYSWGGFKGDTDAWMERYFDAFLYLANWGTHVLKLRLPSCLLDPAIAKTYCGSDSAFVREISGKVILSFASADEEGGEWVEGEALLSSLISVRAELARGDLRALYLGWLLRAQTGELDEAAKEPPVPPGLGRLSASLGSLVQFLRIDGDLLHVAARASLPIRGLTLESRQVSAWVGGLPTKDKDELIGTLMMDANHAAVPQLLQRYLREAGAAARPGAEGRTVARLLQAAEEHARERERKETQKRAEEKARRELEATLARQKYLTGLVGREADLWARVDDLVAARQPKSYDEAVNLLVDLRDLCARDRRSGFLPRIETLLQAHARKPSFIERLRKAGMTSGGGTAR